MADATNPFAKFVPGFEFLESLAKNAQAAMPAMGQWVAPTLSPEELDKRIGELRTVQFWLEQNARMLGTTIQALEVQRMTLNTLRTMNVQMNDLRDALTIKPAAKASPPTAAPARTLAPVPAAAPAPAPASEPGAAAEAPPAPPAVDPMQWWGALTRQFADIANKALQDGAAAAQQMRTSAEPPATPDAGEPPAEPDAGAKPAQPAPPRRRTKQ